MGSQIVNYVSLGIFFAVVLVIILLILDKCNDPTKNTKNVTSISPYEKAENKKFLDNNVYSNTPVNYEYLVNYPNGPRSWGEWSWGKSKEKCKGNCNYSYLYSFF